MSSSSHKVIGSSSRNFFTAWDCAICESPSKALKKARSDILRASRKRVTGSLVLLATELREALRLTLLIPRLEPKDFDIRWLLLTPELGGVEELLEAAEEEYMDDRSSAVEVETERNSELASSEVFVFRGRFGSTFPGSSFRICHSRLAAMISEAQSMFEGVLHHGGDARSRRISYQQPHRPDPLSLNE